MWSSECSRLRTHLTEDVAVPALNEELVLAELLELDSCLFAVIDLVSLSAVAEEGVDDLVVDFGLDCWVGQLRLEESRLCMLR